MVIFADDISFVRDLYPVLNDPLGFEYNIQKIMISQGTSMLDIPINILENTNYPDLTTQLEDYLVDKVKSLNLLNKDYYNCDIVLPELVKFIFIETSSPDGRESVILRVLAKRGTVQLKKSWMQKIKDWIQKML